MKEFLILFLFLVLINLLLGCVLTPNPGPDYSGLKNHCKSRGGPTASTIPNNPVFFSCADGTSWERKSGTKDTYIELDRWRP